MPCSSPTKGETLQQRFYIGVRAYDSGSLKVLNDMSLFYLHLFLNNSLTLKGEGGMSQMHFRHLNAADCVQAGAPQSS